jgi:hypothetical protein
MSTAKQYFIMFRAKEGGVIEPIPWDPSSMKANESIIIVDEENLVIWLWNGKGQTLIDRRTAFRQAESLKGHGYTIGNTIYGRGLTKVIEIDERKIGKDPETDNNYKQFKALMESTFTDAGNNVMSKTIGGSGAAPKVEPKKEQAKPEPSKLEAPKVEATPAKKTEPAVVAPKLEKKPESHGPSPAGGTHSDYALQGIFILSALDVFNDVFISKKSSGYYSMENLDSQICEFKVEGGELKFNDGSFEKIEPGKKEEILGKYKQNKLK